MIRGFWQQLQRGLVSFGVDLGSGLHFCSLGARSRTCDLGAGLIIIFWCYALFPSNCQCVSLGCETWSFQNIKYQSVPLLFFFFLYLKFSLFFPLYICVYIFYWSVVDLTVLQVHNKVIQLYIYKYNIFQTIFHDRLLQDTDYSSLCCTVDLCCLLHIFFKN